MSQYQIRVIHPNDLHVMMTQFLDAARHIHTVMSWSGDEDLSQVKLNAAMHAALAGAEQVRQMLARPTLRLRDVEKET